MGEHKQTSIGALWSGVSSPTPIPTAEEREVQQRRMVAGLLPIRHQVLLRYEELFGEWRPTFSQNGRSLRESRVNNDHTLEGLIERGRGFACLADRQAVDLGMRNGLGMVMLSLDSEQMAVLDEPK